MEKTSFGTVDRYFSDKNEKRIWRVSFFWRTIAIFILTALLSMAIGLWLMNLDIVTAIVRWPLVLLLLSIVLIFSLPVLIRKRCHDFGYNGKMVSFVILGSLILNFCLNSIDLTIAYTLGFEVLLKRALGPTIFDLIAGYIAMWLGIWSLIIWIVLVFYPGQKEENLYWNPQ